MTQGEEAMQDVLAMNRRALMQRAMLLLGATAVAGCDMLPGSKTKVALGADQMKLLEAYADTLIPKTNTPGAVAAGVPKVLAHMFADWASDATRVELSGALDRIGAAAREKTGKGFAALDPAARQTFLAAHDKAALQNVPPPKDAPKGNPFAPAVSVADMGYHTLKDLVATLYYASEAALTSELAYEHIPGGWTASVKVTPATKPAVTFGAF